MSPSKFSSIEDRVLNNAKELLETLENEFTALESLSFDVLEPIQLRKTQLLESISFDLQQAREDTAVTDLGWQLPEATKALLVQCREKHLKNDIILRKQIDHTEALLTLLTSSHRSPSANVYDKLGRMTK